MLLKGGMNVILYMAVTANSMIAGEGDDVEWVGEASWKRLRPSG